MTASRQNSRKRTTLPRRKRYTSASDHLTLLERQEGKCGCGVVLVKGNYIVEHSTPLALGGTDTLANKYLNCKACAAVKTYGGEARATTYGSDIHAIAKTRRLRGETKQKPKRKWPKGRKMPARPFPKR